MNTKYLRSLIITSCCISLSAFGLASCVKEDTKVSQASANSSHAKIIECVSRPATPFELSQGAHFGLTMRAVVPLETAAPDVTPIPTPPLDPEYPGFVLAGTTGDPFDGPVMNVTNKSVSVLQKSIESDKPDYIEIENTMGLRWRCSAGSVDPLPVSVSLVDDRHFYPPAFEALTSNYKLKTVRPPFPDPRNYRKSNFKVSRATLLHNPYSPTLMRIKLYFDNVADMGAGLLTKPQCVGYWNWGEKKPFYRLATAHNTEYTASKQPSSILITIEIENLRLSPVNDTKVHGLLSVSNGWPQDIVVECPPKLPTKSTEINLKFSTKLAPLIASK